MIRRTSASWCRAIARSTLHFSKALDFPVVPLYMPYLHRRGQYDEEQTERLLEVDMRKAKGPKSQAMNGGYLFQDITPEESLERAVSHPLQVSRLVRVEREQVAGVGVVEQRKGPDFPFEGFPALQQVGHLEVQPP